METLTTERTIPILPCRSIDDVIDFYVALGFAVPYRQERPNTFAIVRRGGIELQFFVLKALDPAQSYSTCYVLVPDVDALYAAFTEGLRTTTGRVPSRGIPRIGPVKDMSYGVRQFVMVDPGGNYIRIGQPIEARPPLRADIAGRLERALEAAVLLADSKQDDAAAAKVLESAFAAGGATDAPAPIVVRARILQADLAWRGDDRAGAIARLADARAIGLDEAERAAIADDLGRALELDDYVAQANA